MSAFVAIEPMADVALLETVSVLHIGGADAQSFLHAQLSSDVSALPAGKAQLATYCSPQGRVLAVIHLAHTADGFLALLSRDIAAETARRLRLFVLRARVEISVRDDLAVAAAWGSGLDRTLAAAGLPIPATGDCTQVSELTIVDALAPVPSAFLVCPVSALDTDKLTAPGAAVQESAAWTLARIEASVPEIHAPTADRFLPQMLGLDELGAVDFRKGCYPGQEVIARARYRGQVKRHIVRGSSPVALEPGTRLSVDGKEAGMILMSAKRQESGWRFLAVGRDALTETGKLIAPDGSEISLD